MLNEMKKIWADSQLKLMEDEYQKAKREISTLSPHLKNRTIQTLFDAHDSTLKNRENYENFTQTGINNLIKLFK